jgi:hypothetical protein
MTSEHYDIYPSRHDPDLEDFYRAHGMEPPWTRVWSNGRDVTDEDPSTWPWPWNPDLSLRGVPGGPPDGLVLDRGVNLGGGDGGVPE